MNELKPGREHLAVDTDLLKKSLLLDRSCGVVLYGPDEDALDGEATVEAPPVETLKRKVRRVEQEVVGVHFLFLLDESGSMNSKWQELERAYRRALAILSKQAGADKHLISVVTMSSSGDTAPFFDGQITHHRSHGSVFRLRQQSLKTALSNQGSTLSHPRFQAEDFHAGLTEASKAFHSSMRNHVIFMSDGVDTSGNLLHWIA